MAQMTPAMLDAFGEAFNRHDVDAILKFMTDDCVFESYAVASGSWGGQRPSLGVMSGCAPPAGAAPASAPGLSRARHPLC